MSETEKQLEADGPGFDVVDSTLRNLPRILMLVAGIMVLYLIWSFASSPLGKELGKMVGVIASVLAQMAKHWYLFFLLLVPTIISVIGKIVYRFDQRAGRRVINTAIQAQVTRDSKAYRKFTDAMQAAETDGMKQGISRDVIFAAFSDPDGIGKIEDDTIRDFLNSRVETIIVTKSDYMLETNRKIPGAFSDEIKNLDNTLQKNGMISPPALTHAIHIANGTVSPDAPLPPDAGSFKFRPFKSLR